MADRDACPTERRSANMESQESTGNQSGAIEQRLRRLEDIEEIKKLKARYCEA